MVDSSLRWSFIKIKTLVKCGKKVVDIILRM